MHGVRAVTYLENLSRCSNIQTLTHPLVSGPSIEDLDDSHEVICLLEKDQLQSFVFPLKDENVNRVMYTMVFSVIGQLKNLKKLKVTEVAATCTMNIEILNNSLGRQSQIEDLEVQFSHKPGEKGTTTAIKFHKYLKKLRRLRLTNVWHRDFSESLFDMAS